MYSQSLGTPPLSDIGPGSDAHHLRPADAQTNSARNNRKFTNGSGNSGIQNKGGWYPGDEWKGDVARMIMYMYLRYPNRCLITNIGIGNNSNTPDDMIDLFLEWNAEDPVSDFERQRNTYHENTTNENAQGNRNPFIDNPYLATLIWGGNDAENRWSTLNIDNYSLLNEIKIYPNPSNTHNINVKIPSRFKNIKITLFSMLGKKIHESKFKNIQQSSYQFTPLKTGIYLLKINNDTSSITKKIIVQ